MNHLAFGLVYLSITDVPEDKMHSNSTLMSNTCEPVQLLDGSSVLVRPISATDAPLICDVFEGLSTASRFNRFLVSKTSLSPAELRHFTTVDHRDHEALIALSSTDGRALGVVRYTRTPGCHRAELAVTVIDEWHGRGLGRSLVERLTERAQAEGIGAFTALVADQNVAAHAMLRACPGPVELVAREFGITEYVLDLT